MNSPSTFLAAALQPYRNDGAAFKNLVELSGVHAKVIRHAINGAKGHATDAGDYLRLCASIGIDPVDGHKDEHGKLLRGEDGKPLPPAGSGKYGSHQIWRKRRIGRQTGTGRWFREVGKHSEKPQEHVRPWIDRCWPCLSKVEIFARGTAPAGWVFWGNQVAAEEVPVDPDEVAQGDRA
jgi:hypothetical protein